MQLLCLGIALLLVLADLVRASEVEPGQCVSDIECGTHAYCSRVLGLCLCDPGHHKVFNSSVDCVPSVPPERLLSCQQSETCSPNEGKCDLTKHQCTCLENYALERNGYACYYNKRQLTDPCQDDAECGLNASCDRARCACNKGFVDDFNGIDCRRALQRLGGHCDSENECGRFAKCQNGRCFCRDTYVPFMDRVNCQPTDSCSSDHECGHNAVCFYQRCQCNEGFQRATLNNGCQKTNNAAVIVFSVLVGIMFLAFLTVFGILIRRRNQRSKTASPNNIVPVNNRTEIQSVAGNVNQATTPRLEFLPTNSAISPGAEYRTVISTHQVTSPISGEGQSSAYQMVPSEQVYTRTIYYPAPDPIAHRLYPEGSPPPYSPEHSNSSTSIPNIEVPVCNKLTFL